VILAEPRSGVAVFEQNASNRGLVLGDDAVVAGEVAAEEDTPNFALTVANNTLQGVSIKTKE
jgi:hypothetical protein